MSQLSKYTNARSSELFDELTEEAPQKVLGEGNPVLATPAAFATGAIVGGAAAVGGYVAEEVADG